MDWGEILAGVDWGQLLATLIGAGIAGAVAFGVAWVNRTTTREDRRAEILRRAAAELLTAARDLWQAEQSLQLAVFTLVTERGTAARQERETADADRLEAFAKRHEAERAAEVAVSELWLVSPTLRDVGQNLIAACRIKPKRDTPLPTQGERERYDDARAALVEAVRDVIG